jgi:hypothetical protein
LQPSGSKAQRLSLGSLLHVAFLARYRHVEGKVGTDLRADRSVLVY